MASKYDDIARSVAAEQAYGPIYSAQYADAMKSGKANELARRIGIPPEIVEASMPDMLTAARVQKRIAETQRNHRYAQIMSNPRVAAAAMDDDHLPRLADKLDRQVSIFSPEYIGMAATHLAGSIGDMLGGGANYIQGLGESATFSRQQRKSLGGPLSFLDNLPDPVEALGPVGRSLAVLPNWISDHTSPSTGNKWKDAGLSGFRSAGSSLGALAVGLLTRSPAAAAAVIAGQSGGMTYRDARKEGLDPSKALTYATTDAEIEMATEFGPQKFLIGRAGKGVFGTIAGDIGRELFGESAATLGQSFDRWFYVDRQQGQSFGDYVKTLPEQLAQTAIAVGITAGTVGGSLNLINRQIERNVTAKAAQHVDKIMEAAAQSQTRTTNPSDFEMALNQVLEDSPSEHIYVPAQEIAKMFEGEGATPIADDPFWSRYAAQVEEAAALGQDVVIPLSEAATHIAGTPHWDALRDHVRVSPKGMSIAEAKEMGKPDDLEALAARMGELVNEAVPRMQQAQALASVKDFASGLGYQGEQADAISRYVAGALYTRYRGEMEKRAAAGEAAIPVEQFAQEWLPQVTRQAQAQYEKGATFEQQHDFSETKVVDERGEPLQVYHGTTASFDEFHPFSHFGSEEAARDRLVALRGDPADENYDATPGEKERVIAALLDIRKPLKITDTGQDQTINELIADAQTEGAISQGEAQELLNGDPEQVYDEFFNLLKSRGYDGFVYENTAEDVGSTSWVPFSHDQIRIVNEQGTAQGAGSDNAAARRTVKDYEQVSQSTKDAISATFNQEVSPLVFTPEFREWFGDSKVVDEQGNPLVVYHGTTGDFEAFDPKKGSVETDFGQGIYATSSREDAATNYAGDGPDLTNRIERWIEQNYPDGLYDEVEGREITDEEAKRQAKEALIHEGAHDGLLMPLFLSIQNPLVLGTHHSGRNEDTYLTWEGGRPEIRYEERDGEEVFIVGEEVFTDESEADERADEIEAENEPTGTLFDLLQGLRDAAEEFDADPQEVDYAIQSVMENADYGEGISARKAIATLRDKLSYVYDPDTGDVAGNEVIRYAAEKAGFDGIIDNTVNDKFGTGKRGFGGARMLGMAGVTEDTTHYIAFKPTQAKSFFNRGTFSSTDPLILNQEVTPSEEVFYSNATRAVENARQEKASADQWIALLTPGRTPGIKAEEIEWTGILDWLKMQKGQIEKAALLQVLRDRGILVEEVVNGTPLRNQPIQDGDGWSVVDAYGNAINEEPYATLMEAEEAAGDFEPLYEGRPQFQNWSSDPSNETYRELLITLPLGQGSNPERAPSTHWDTEAVVAHVRFMEKQDAEGKRVLFIEEVQSDWHQKGRDEGYEVDQSAKRAELNIAIEQAIDERKKAGLALIEAARPLYKETLEWTLRSPDTTEDEKQTARLNLQGLNGIISPDGMIRNLRVWSTERAEEIRKNELAAYQAAQLRESEARQAFNRATDKLGIPDAPFKTSWPALVMKRAIRWAVDNGYERVAWTTGEEQAERYNLAATVGTIGIERTGEDEYRLNPMNGRIVGVMENHFGAAPYSAAQIKEVFGSDLGGRMVKGADEAPTYSNGAPTTVFFEGDDLKVGGEGMKAFYDRNLVNITNDIIKKYGTKVGPIRVPQPRMAEYAATANALRRDADALVRSDDRLAEGLYDRANEIDNDPRSSRLNPGFDITPELATAAAGGFPLFQQKRGNITIQPGDNGLMQSAIIRAFEAANFSTAVHELGHFFLEDLKRRALGANATASERADWQTVKDWTASLGHVIEDHSPIPVQAHEYFARGMERFVWEGKAPSLGLRAIFTRMREFMLSLYRTATAFNAPITPEIRDVMGRMLASQEEIDAQRAELGLVSKAIKGLLSETEQRAYDDLAEETRQSARDKLYERVLSSLRNQKKAEHRVERDSIKAEAEAQVADQPIHRALKLLRVGQPLPDGTFAKIKLDREWLIDTYGEDIVDRLPKTVPPIVSQNDTMDADMIAALVGYESGDKLVKELLGHEAERQAMRESGDKRSPRQKAVDEIVEERMREELGDPFAHLEEEAQDAVASDRQADLMMMEVRALARKTGQKPTPWKLAKDFAKNRIAMLSAREAISGKAIQTYARAVAKAGREYEEFLVAGDFEEAFRAKQRQLVNTALMSEAKKAANDVDAAVRRMRKTAGRDVIPSVDADYLEQAHALLADVDLKSNYRQSDRAGAFASWHASQVELGILPVVPAGYRELLGKTHWSKLTVPELIELDTAVKQIIELGRLKKKLRDGMAERDFDEAVAELVGTAEMRKTRRDAKSLGERTLPERARSILRSADAAMVKMEQIAKWLDGDELQGPWQRLIFQVMSRAQGREDDLMRQYVGEINAIIKGLPKNLVKRWTDKVDAPELVNDKVPALFKDQIVMAAMNWGNEGNRQRLLDGYGWDEAAVQQVFDRLMTKEDWDFVQQVWDTVDKLWPEVAALERRVNGLAPEKVEATPVMTRHGIYRGGYFPVVYDPSLSSRAAIDEDNKMSPEGGFMMVTTRAGATKARAEAVKDRPLLLSASVITRHLGEVIHDITHREAVMQVKKIIGDKRIGDAVRQHLGPEYLKAMGSWIENIARPGSMYSKDVPALVALGRYFNKAVAMVGLGFRVSTVAMQLLGIPVAAGEVGEKRLLTALATVTAHPLRSWNEMQARSAEMRARADTLDATIEDMVHQAANGKLAAIGPKGMQKYAMRGIAYMDMVVSTTIWTAGFNKALAQGLSEDDAVHYADQVVRTTQGSGGGKDRSSIQNAHPMVRSFYPFFSYLNALFNMQRDVFRTAGEGRYMEAARKGWWVMIVPAMAQTLIFQVLLGGDGPDGGDDGEVDGGDWTKYLLTQLALGNLGSIPGLGTLAQTIGSGYSYRSSAYNTIGEGILREVKDVKKVIADEKDVDSSTVKATINTIGLLTAQPLGQIGATTGGLYDYATGQAEPENAKDWYQLLTKGRIAEEAE